MRKFNCDLHIHSCLSPCGDDEMTPMNIAGMGHLSGLEIMALTDHNSSLNCPAFFRAAQEYGIVPVPGMELTTAEEIHVVCLFETLEDAMAFSEEVGRRRVLIKNKTAVFGNQIIMDENDQACGQEEFFLTNATEISIDEAPDLAARFNGICFPAHIDRDSYSIISVLGVMPGKPYFAAAEIYNPEKTGELKEKFPVLNEKIIVTSSDAHYLWNIGDRNSSIEFDCPDSPEEIRKALIRRLGGR